MMYLLLLVAAAAAATLGARATWQVQRVDLARLRAERDLAEGEAAREHRRAEEYLAQIEGILREKNEAWRIYWQAGAQHATAQDMMLREITRLGQIVKVVSPAELAQIAADFRAAHGGGPPVEPAPPPRPLA